MKKISQFMYGRYGFDQLGIFLFVSTCIIFVFTFFSPWLTLVFYGVMIYSLIRLLSKNFALRRRENEWYMKKTNGIRKYLLRQKNRWAYRHTHKYLKCQHCRQYLRVPKNKGMITITCPKCHHSFDKKT